MVVEIVEADFAPSDHFRMLCQAREVIEMLARYFLRFMRMDSDCCVNPIMLFCERQCSVQFFGTRSRANRHERGDSGSPRAVEHCVPVVCKLRKIYVGVRID